MLHLFGEFIDTLNNEARAPQPNLVVARALDLIADLLANRQAVRGLLYWAVGAGDPAWDALPSPPLPDRLSRTLVKEIYRKRLEPADLNYDAATHTLTVHTVFLPGEATADLREFGLFGGDASGLFGSGYLFNTARHAVIHKLAGQPLDRTLKLTLAGDRVVAGLLDTVGQLLGNRPGAAGVRAAAFGSGDPSWDQTPPAADPQRTALQQELLRKPVDPVQDIEVVSYQQALVVHAALEYREAATTVREVGLFGGNASAPVLLEHLAFPAMDHSVARRLRFDVRLGIGVDPSIAVPDVTTRSLADATTTLAAAGLQVGAVREEERADGKNTVLRQVPAAGEKAVDGASVLLTLAVPISIPAPRLIGLTTAAAAPVLATLGLTLSPDRPQMESPFPPDSILSQVPAPGDLIRPGSAVRVIVAIPETTLVPDLTGTRPAEAALVLRASRLVLAGPPYPTVQTRDGWGSIVAQNPGAGTRQVVGTAVTPSLAAPPFVVVPSLVGASLADASKLLRDAAAPILKAGGMPSEPPGLAVGQTTYLENAAAPGTILTQTPGAGQTSILFGSVDINVATPVTVLVPNLAGLLEQAASTALRNIGLLPGKITRRMDPAPPGTVLAQDPPANSRVAVGSLVSFTTASVIQVQVPLLLGRSVDFAKEALLGSRLTLGTVTRVPTTTAPPGTITAQDQPAGKFVDINSAINITIAGNTVQMPSLINVAEAAARKVLADIGLTLVVGAPVESAQVAQGLIAGQSPAVNTVVPVGSTVTVNLAIPPKVPVPNLVGRTLQDAQAAAIAAKFTLSVTGQAESDLAPGTVAAQAPPAGQPAAPGSAIAVQTAVPRSVTVPRFIDLTLAAATTQAAGLNLVVSQRILSTKPAEIVLDQNPGAGVKVAPRSTVTLVVSSGIGVTVPSVLKQTLAVASNNLKRLGLTVDSEILPSAGTPGTVVNQDPASGAFVPQGSSVFLTVAGPRKIPPGNGGRPTLPF